jgi:hypothetical protein
MSDTLINEMPSEAKVWIYGANRVLTNAEVAEITDIGNSFTQTWTAHQQQLKATFAILHNVFMVVMVDERHNAVSGCGIDKSVHLMQDIDKQYQLDLFNRLRIELWQANQVVLTNKQKLSVMLQEGTVNEQTFVFNKSISTKAQFDTSFQIPLSESWVFPSLMAGLAK